MIACVSTPISWPRLEAHALARDAAVTAHLAECAACRSCMDEIERDVVALPALPAGKPRRTRWWFALVPALAAAAILVFVLRPRGAENVLHIKGVGELELELVRERAGTITFDAQTFAPGDRWKVVVTCPPDHAVAIRVEVRDGKTIDQPLAPATAECGNRVALPGAFTLDGGENRVCVIVDDQTACLSVRPE